MAETTMELKRIKKLLLDHGSICEKWEELFRDIVTASTRVNFSTYKSQLLIGQNMDCHIHRLLEEVIRVFPKNFTAKIAEAAQELGYNKLHDDLQNIGGSTMSFSWNEQKVDDNFSGRSLQLSKLDEFYQKSASNITVLSGLPGMGTSEIAKEFLRRSLANQIYTVWIHSQKSSQLKENLNELAKQELKLSDVNQKDSKTLSLLVEISKSIFERTGKRWVIVFDSCEPKTAQENCLFEFSQLCYDQVMTIITAKVRKFDYNTNVVDVDELEISEAETLAKSILPQESNEAISLLCAFTKKFPIVLRMAIGCIKNHQTHDITGPHYDIKSYILDHKKEKEQNHFLSPFSSSATHEKMFFDTLIATLKKIKYEHQEAFAFLEILSYGNPNAFPMAMLRSIYNIDASNCDEEKFIKSLNSLKEFCILKSFGNLEKLNLEINPIVQNVTKQFLLKPDNTGLQKVIKYLTTTEISSLQEIANIKQCTSLWRNVANYGDTKIMGIAEKILTCLEKHNLYYDMRKFLKTTSPLYKKPELKNSPIAATIIQKYALILVEFEMLDAAHKECEYLLDLHSKEGNQEQVFDCLHDIANIHLNQGELDKAQALYQKVLEQRLNFYNCENAKTMATRAQIANTYTNQNQFVKAKLEFQKVINWQIEEKNNISNGLMSIHSLGYCHFKEECYAEARRLFESALETVDGISLNKTGTLICQYNLSRTLFYVGEHEEGLKMLKAVYAEQLSIFGKAHPDSKKILGYINKFEEIYRAAQGHNFKDAESGKFPKPDSEDDLPLTMCLSCQIPYSQQKALLKEETKQELLKLTISKYKVKKNYSDKRIKLAESALQKSNKNSFCLNRKET